MGAVTFSLDSRLLDALKHKLPFDIFVETGTFQGDTIHNVRDQFKHLYSVELSQKYYKDAVQKFSGCSNITLIHDDSAKAIATIQPQIQSRPTIYWLDAHWCVANDTEGQASQCPLLAEIEAIQHLNNESMIIIDDARLFLTTPPAPHESADWPSFHAIIDALFKLSSSHRITVLNDCILFYPECANNTISEFAYRHGINWLTVLDKSRDYDTLLAQLKEKEDMIQLLANALEEERKKFAASHPILNLFKSISNYFSANHKIRGTGNE